MDAVKFSSEISKKEGTMLFLADCTKFESNDPMPIYNTYELSKLYEQIGVDHQIKEAIIAPEDATITNGLKLFEFNANNQGYLIKIFKNRNHALEWLQQDPQKFIY